LNQKFMCQIFRYWLWKLLSRWWNCSDRNCWRWN